MNKTKEVDELVQRSKLTLGSAPAKIPIEECGDKMVLLEGSERVLVSPVWDTEDKVEAPLYRQYISNNPKYQGIYLRHEVAMKLKEAQANLPNNWSLVVRAGHRPVGVQKDLFQFVKAELAKEHPDSSDEELTILTRDYVSDPDFKVPPHCAGSAVDLEALDITTGELVDFGSPMNEDSDISHIHSTKVNSGQNSNRLILLKVMLRAGFAPLKEEWWHFSYGDQNWAAFHNEPKAIYGIKEPEI